MFILVIYIFHFWLLHAFFNCFFVSKKHQSFSLKIIAWACFFIVQLFISSQITYPLILFTFNCFVTICLCRLLYLAPLKKLLFLSITFCATGMLIEVIVSLVMQIIGDNINSGSILGAVLSKLVLLAFVHSISIIQTQNSRRSPALSSWILLLFMTISSIVIIHTLYLFNQTSSFLVFQVLSFLSIILLLFINVGFFLFDDKLSKYTDMKVENSILSQQLKHYEALRAAKEEQINFFNREKHNLKNQLLSIRAFALKADSSAIINFINSLLKDPDFGLTPFSVCENLIFDAIISSKVNVAKNNKIKYTWDIDVPHCLPFNDTDLCVLLGNAIENSLEACLNAKSTNKFVHIAAHYKQNFLYMHIENTYTHQLVKSGRKFFSTKRTSRLHGYGLPSIQHVVNKYDGVLLTETKNNLFELKIILYPT